MHDRTQRLARLQRLRREGRRLDDQKFLLPRPFQHGDDETPLSAAMDLMLRFGG